jgi:phospholipid-transporting ATPase
MSTVVRGPDGRIKLYCKGADTVILERLGPNQPYTDRTMAHLEVREGAVRPARAYSFF